MENPEKENSTEKNRRTEHRTVLSSEQYSSVEFIIKGLAPTYIYRVRDISTSGLGILVTKESAILQHIKVGDVLTLAYNPKGKSNAPEHLRTEIRHITEDDRKFKGHVLVGLYILIGKDNT